MEQLSAFGAIHFEWLQRVANWRFAACLAVTSARIWLISLNSVRGFERYFLFFIKYLCKNSQIGFKIVDSTE